MAMGIIMTGFTLFGMLALVIASVYTDDGVEVTEEQSASAEPTDEVNVPQKAA